MKTSLGKLIRKTLEFLLIAGGFFLFRSWYMTPDVSGGELAENFAATTLDGQTFNLEDLRGNYVLLQFWGSWCGPCRQQHPELVKTIAELNGQLIPVSIAIETDSTRWQRAIRQDGLRWPHHVMDKTTNTKFLNGPISDLYGVNSVPTDFLIDPEGRVVGVGLSFQEIVSMIE